MTKDVLRELRLAAAFEEQGGERSLSEDAADEIEAIRTERDALQKQCEDWAESASRMTERHDAKVEALEAERDALKARVAETAANWSAFAERVTAELQRQHDARVAELLEANNREVERRRRSEQFRTGVTCPECGIALGMTSHRLDCETGAEIERKMMPEWRWLWNNKAALQALAEGRAAVLPLTYDDERLGLLDLADIVYSNEEGEVSAPVAGFRLDKPVENK